MWILKWIVILLVLLLIISFSLYNQGQSVDLRFMKWESGQIPLYLALFISFGLGMAAFLLISAVQQLQTFSELAKMKKSFKKLQKELEELHKDIESKNEEISNVEEEKARLRHNSEILQNKLDAAISGSVSTETNEEKSNEE